MAKATTPEQARLNELKHRGEREYPKQIWYLIGCIIAVATFCNFCSILWAWRCRTAYRQTCQSSVTRKGVASPRRLPSAILTASRIWAFRWRIPAINMTLLEVLLAAIYIVALFSWEFINTQGLILRYWANRSGHIAAAQIPLIVALSSKNNAIGLLTGIGHEKLNLMHRVTARVTLFMTWIHLWARYQTQHDMLESAWITAGLVAGIAQTLMVFVSFRFIRKRFYESFYVSHMLLLIVFIVTTYVHLAGANPGYAYYLWPSFIVWGLDRVIRYLHYFFNNTLFKPKRSIGHLELVSKDTLRLTVQRHIPGGWRAGQHMFLAFPTFNPTQSHPFSISTIPIGEKKEKELVWIIRARGGLTRKMKEYVAKNGACDVPVFLDGPYGAPPDITAFSTCVFIAGGSGISYIFPRFQEILSQVSSGEACARRVVFVWAVRKRSHVKWISSYLAQTIKSIPSNVTVTISIFVTGNVDVDANRDGHSVPDTSYDETPELSPAISRDIEKTSADDSDEKVSTAGSVNSVDAIENMGVSFAQGRPDLKKILEEELSIAEGPMSVDVSGPEPLVASVRSKLSCSFAGPMQVLRGGPTVQMNVEEFTM